jgi:hypothetical protein
MRDQDLQGRALRPLAQHRQDRHRHRQEADRGQRDRERDRRQRGAGRDAAEEDHLRRARPDEERREHRRAGREVGLAGEASDGEEREPDHPRRQCEGVAHTPQDERAGRSVVRLHARGIAARFRAVAPRRAREVFAVRMSGRWHRAPEALIRPAIRLPFEVRSWPKPSCARPTTRRSARR